VLRFPHNHHYLSRIPCQYAIQPAYVPRPNPCLTNLTGYSLLRVLDLPCKRRRKMTYRCSQIHRLFHRPASAPIKSLVCSHHSGPYVGSRNTRGWNYSNGDSRSRHLCLPLTAKLTLKCAGNSGTTYPQIEPRQ
jgi:hypothetical protein